MSKTKSPLVKPNPEEILLIYQELLPRPKIKELVKASGITLYWRLLTPLVVLWMMIFQRLNSDHTCDAAISHLHTGAVDTIDPEDEHEEPLSKRFTSENTSSYVQGRNRLPLSVLQGILQYVAQRIRGWLQDEQAEKGTWKGHIVRLLDGTTYRLRPRGDLVETYGQAKNQHGDSYWVIVRSVAAFCLWTQSAVACAEGPGDKSEPAMVKEVMAQDDAENSLYIGDRNFGVYRVVQVADHYHKEVILRLKATAAKRLQRASGRCRLLRPGEECLVSWAPTPQIKVEPGLSTAPIEGRLIYARIERNGFRPIDLYIFTTLLDPVQYPAEDICQLYGQRLQVEIDYRHIKTTMEMEEFDVHSAAMFRKELAAGLLAYNLICASMVKAAMIGDLPPSKLSFSRCWRRVRDVLLKGVPAWVYEQGSVQDYLLTRLAKCKLPHQPNKVRYEPRKVRRRPAVFPALKGDRDTARQEILNQWAA